MPRVRFIEILACRNAARSPGNLAKNDGTNPHQRPSAKLTAGYEMVGQKSNAPCLLTEEGRYGFPVIYRVPTLFDSPAIHCLDPWLCDTGLLRLCPFGRVSI